MRFPWKAFAAGGLVLGTAAFVLRTKQAEPKAARIALIGDSYAVGLGPELKKLLPDFESEGRVGAGTRSYVVPPWLATWKPALALVSLGVNDGQRPDRNNYVEIIRQLYAAGVKQIVWIPPPEGVRAPQLRELLGTLGVRVLPATNTPLAGDGVHPRSYGPWAREIANARAT